jgi:hypothetical protein
MRQGYACPWKVTMPPLQRSPTPTAIEAVGTLRVVSGWCASAVKTLAFRQRRAMASTYMRVRRRDLPSFVFFTRVSRPCCKRASPSSAHLPSWRRRTPVTTVHSPVGVVRAHARRGPTLTQHSLRHAVVHVSLCCFAIPHGSVCTSVCMRSGQRCPATRLCAPGLCEGVLVRCTATMRTKRAAGFPDTEGHGRGGDPRPGPAAISSPPGRDGGLMTVLCHMALVPCPPSDHARSVPTWGRPTHRRATCCGGRPYASRGPAGRGPLPTGPCQAVGTMPMDGHPAALPRP